MCGCERHQDQQAECTCICPEHRNFDAAYALAMSRYDEIQRLAAAVDLVEGLNVEEWADRAEKAHAAYRKAEAERDRLARWKAEALPVLDGLQEIGKALNLPLGTRVTGPQALEAIEALQAERDRLAAAVERVEALEPTWHAGMYGCPDDMFSRRDLRAALSDAGRGK